MGLPLVASDVPFVVLGILIKSMQLVALKIFFQWILEKSGLLRDILNKQRDMFYNVAKNVSRSDFWHVRSITSSHAIVKLELHDLNANVPCGVIQRTSRDQPGTFARECVQLSYYSCYRYIQMILASRRDVYCSFMTWHTRKRGSIIHKSLKNTSNLTWRDSFAHGPNSCWLRWFDFKQQINMKNVLKKWRVKLRKANALRQVVKFPLWSTFMKVRDPGSSFNIVENHPHPCWPGYFEQSVHSEPPEFCRMHVHNQRS